jgi:hypothetical protein
MNNNHVDDEAPDFSGDDFADDVDIQRQRSDAQRHKEMVNDAMIQIASAFSLQEMSDDSYDESNDAWINLLEKFVMFNNLNGGIEAAYSNTNGADEMLVVAVEHTTSYPTARNSNRGSNLCLLGMIRLKKSYPKTYICRETIREKIMDFFLRRETDFPEHKKFSDKFYLLTDDAERLRTLFQFSPLDELVQFPELELEIQGDYCLFRHSGDELWKEEGLKHIELTRVLQRIFS